MLFPTTKRPFVGVVRWGFTTILFSFPFLAKSTHFDVHALNPHMHSSSWCLPPISGGGIRPIYPPVTNRKSSASFINPPALIEVIGQPKKNGTLCVFLFFIFIISFDALNIRSPVWPSLRVSVNIFLGESIFFFRFGIIACSFFWRRVLEENPSGSLLSGCKSKQSGTVTLLLPGSW